MIINTFRLKKVIDDNIKLLMIGNLKFLYHQCYWFMEWIHIQLIKIDKGYYPHLMFYTPKIDKTYVLLYPFDLKQFPQVSLSYEEKINLIKRFPQILFLIDYPSNEMIETYLKTSSDRTWKQVKLFHIALNDVHAGVRPIPSRD